MMDEKLVQYEAHSTLRFDKIDESLYEIQQLLSRDIKGKETDTVLTPIIGHSQAPFQQETCIAMRENFDQAIPLSLPLFLGARVVHREASRNNYMACYARVDHNNR